VLVCNAPDDADAILDTISSLPSDAEAARILSLRRNALRDVPASPDANARYARARDNITGRGFNASKPAG
jgi:hypothetical protein